MTRNGKIARLPRTVREELNRRMRDGEDSQSLIKWLHGLEEVMKFINTQCGGHGISRSNLSQWRLGGYVEWVAKEEILREVSEMSVSADELQQAGGGKLSDQLAVQLASRLVQVLAEWDKDPEGVVSPRMKALRHLTRQVMVLRRGDHNAGRLKLAQERFDLDRKETEAEREAAFWERARSPEVQARLQQAGIDDEEMIERARIRLFGSAPP